MPTADEIITSMDLQPLDGEGGFFRQTWILPSGNDVPLGTAIIYLVTPDSFSALHRLDADELFHFYLGDACEQIVVDANGEIRRTVLGSDILSGQHVQSVVPSGCWQGTRLVEGGQWALLGTTMTPGFHLEGFELATVEHIKSMSIETAAIATSYLADGA